MYIALLQRGGRYIITSNFNGITVSVLNQIDDLKHLKTLPEAPLAPSCACTCTFAGDVLSLPPGALRAAAARAQDGPVASAQRLGLQLRQGAGRFYDALLFGRRGEEILGRSCKAEDLRVVTYDCQKLKVFKTSKYVVQQGTGGRCMQSGNRSHFSDSKST